MIGTSGSGKSTFAKGLARRLESAQNGCNSAYCQTIPIGITAVGGLPQPRQIILFPNPVDRLEKTWSLQGLPPESWGKPMVFLIRNMSGSIAGRGEFISLETANIQAPQNLSPGIFLVEIYSEKEVYQGMLLVQ